MNSSIHRYLLSLVTPLVAVMVLTGGCSLPGKSPATARQKYLLQYDGEAGPAPVAEARPCLSLRVGTTSAAPGFTTARMVYTQQAPQLDFFAYHEWVEPPARMFQTMMDSRLDSSGLLGEVISGSSDVRTDLRLDSELKRLQQDFSGAGSSLSLAIKVSLVKMSDRSLLQSKTFSYTESNAGSDPVSGVAAADRAARQFLADLAEFVASAINPLECVSR